MHFARGARVGEHLLEPAGAEAEIHLAAGHLRDVLDCRAARRRRRRDRSRCTSMPPSLEWWSQIRRLSSGVAHTQSVHIRPPSSARSSRAALHNLGSDRRARWAYAVRSEPASHSMTDASCPINVRYTFAAVVCALGVAWPARSHAAALTTLRRRHRRRRARLHRRERCPTTTDEGTPRPTPETGQACGSHAWSSRRSTSSVNSCSGGRSRP